MSDKNAKKEEVKKDNEGGLGTITPKLAEMKLGDFDFKIKVKRLKFRETIALFRVVSAAGKRVQFKTDNPDALMGQLIMAIPYAEREFLDFIKVILDIPPDDKGMRERQVRAYIDKELENDEVLRIVEAIVTQEKDSWNELGKRLTHLGKVFQESFKQNPGQ
jgi:hypothetical protein